MEGIAYLHRRSSGRNCATLPQIPSKVQDGTDPPLPPLLSVRPRVHTQPSHHGIWNSALDLCRPCTHWHPVLIPAASFHAGHSVLGTIMSSPQFQFRYLLHFDAPTGSPRLNSSRPVLPRRFPCSFWMWCVIYNRRRSLCSQEVARYSPVKTVSVSPVCSRLFSDESYESRCAHSAW